MTHLLKNIILRYNVFGCMLSLQLTLWLYTYDVILQLSVSYKIKKYGLILNVSQFCKQNIITLVFSSAKLKGRGTMVNNVVL